MDRTLHFANINLQWDRDADSNNSNKRQIQRNRNDGAYWRRYNRTTLKGSRRNEDIIEKWEFLI